MQRFQFVADQMSVKGRRSADGLASVVYNNVESRIADQ